MDEEQKGTVYTQEKEQRGTVYTQEEEEKNYCAPSSCVHILSIYTPVEGTVYTQRRKGHSIYTKGEVSAYTQRRRGNIPLPPVCIYPVY